MDILQSIRQEVTRYPFEFRGNAKEYFGIWIVNILLSIVTLGIYSAWAKVRRVRYFYGNTFLDGHNFDYHAEPKQILIGRLIVVGVLILFNLSTQFFPLFGLLLAAIYMVVIPWVINRGLRFRNRMTSYRNVRFDFHGNYGRAFLVFVLMPILSIFTLFLLLPVPKPFDGDVCGQQLHVWPGETGNQSGGRRLLCGACHLGDHDCRRICCPDSFVSCVPHIWLYAEYQRP